MRRTAASVDPKPLELQPIVVVMATWTVEELAKRKRLWAEHAEAPTPTTEAALFECYSYLPGWLAGKAIAKAPPHQDRGDLIAYAQIGLLDSIRKFKPEVGVLFETYATRRVTGAIIDGQRRDDPLTRAARKQVKDLEAALRELTETLLREPTAVELAAKLEVPLADVRHQLVIRQSLNASLDDYLAKATSGEGNVEGLHNGQGASGTDLGAHMGEILVNLAEGLARLPDRALAYLMAHYCDHRPDAQVAAELGITEAELKDVRERAFEELVSA